VFLLWHSGLGDRSRVSSDGGPLEPFRIAVPQAALDDLDDRLRRTRWPPALPAPDWERGVPVDYLRHVADHWLHAYDWRAWEARLNELPQLVTVVDGQRIHLVHARSPEAGALPLVITHGWPGSFVELLPVIGPLTDPVAHGGAETDAFHVVVPSLPGFGFSTPLADARWDHVRIARAWAVLMRRLGYDRYGAQGGDTGSVVSPLLGRTDAEHVVGVHINGGLSFPAGDAGDLNDLTPVEQARLAAARALRETGTGYADIQSTKPQTLGFALHDSPVGQLAWILEKFHGWTDPAQPLPVDAVDLDLLLTDVTVYWLTGTATSAANLYYENRVAPARPAECSPVPTAVAVFPTDPAIRRIVEREHTVVQWSEFDRGGHFAALEAPDLLVDDIRRFFRSLR
jgi:pimeloyl-ACP methyl ester carboxylesterase